MRDTLWEKVKDTVEKGLTKASETTIKAIEAAKEQAEIARLKLHISGLKSKISREFAELGGIVYELSVKEEKKDILADKRVLEILEKLEKLEAELKETQAALEEYGSGSHPI